MKPNKLSLGKYAVRYEIMSFDTTECPESYLLGRYITAPGLSLQPKVKSLCNNLALNRFTEFI